MAFQKDKGVWWTNPTLADDDKSTIIVTGRDDVSKYRAKGIYTIRIDVTWRYNSDASGMPTEDDSRLMGEATEALIDAFDHNTAAILTGIYTGAGERNWVFYTRSTSTFQSVFNSALRELPLLPLEISAENDAEWAEYDEMRSLTRIEDAN